MGPQAADDLVGEGVDRGMQRGDGLRHRCGSLHPSPPDSVSFPMAKAIIRRHATRKPPEPLQMFDPGRLFPAVRIRPGVRRPAPLCLPITPRIIKESHGCFLASYRGARRRGRRTRPRRPRHPCAALALRGARHVRGRHTGHRADGPGCRAGRRPGHRSGGHRRGGPAVRCADPLRQFGLRAALVVRRAAQAGGAQAVGRQDRTDRGRDRRRAEPARPVGCAVQGRQGHRFPRRQGPGDHRPRHALGAARRSEGGPARGVAAR